MNNAKQKGSYVFPLSVWVALLLPAVMVIALLAYIQGYAMASGTDRLLLVIALALIILLSLLWLLIITWLSFGLSFGKLVRQARWLLFFLYYPAALFSAFLLRIKKQKLQESFLAFQNRLFLSARKLGKQSRLLLLLPHCLQYHDCKIRVTRDINSCEDCGECDICNLKDLGKRFELKIGIANGGTLARKIVHDIQPDAIIAVACHRDLTDGVRESWKYPVYAILNERPYGPCFDTKVDTDKVESIINSLLENETQT